MLEASTFGFKPLRDGSCVKGARRFTGCGMPLGRYSSSSASGLAVSTGFSEADGVKYIDSLLIFAFGLAWLRLMEDP
jgi:hypothetical protein